MAEKKTEEKKPFEWLRELSHFISEIFNVLIAHSDAEIQKIKKKVVHYIVVYGLFSIALFFILLGFIKYLADINFFPSEAIGLMITGAVIIVVLAAYSLLNKI